MAKITLELTDTIIKVSGPSSFLPLNKAVGSSSKQFKIVLDTATATADLSKIGTAADNTTLVFYGKSTDYQASYTAKTGILNVLDNTRIVASLPIPKLAADNVKLHFTDYADATYVTLSKPAVGSSSLVLSGQPDLSGTTTVTLSSSAATVNEGSTVTYTATLDKVSATDLNIPYTVTGSKGFTTADITVSTLNTIKIVAGSKTGALVLTAVSDATTEGAETVTVTLGAVANVKLGVVTQSTIINDTSLTATVPVNTAPINISATLLTGTATAAADVFNIASGNYTATIAGFNNGDKLTFFSGASVSMLSDANNADKTQQFQIEDPATGNTAIITLTGLTDAQDAALFTKASFDLVFGTGTLA